MRGRERGVRVRGEDEVDRLRGKKEGKRGKKRTMILIDRDRKRRLRI